MEHKLTRLIDHLALPVPSLEIARSRYEKLGFTVAPEANHSFGTKNACVNFSNGTFLEPLAIGDGALVKSENEAGNTFLRRDAAFRFRQGDNGFSLVALSESDPALARQLFKAASFETGKMVTVRRPGVKVRLGFVQEARSPDAAFFVCERPNGLPQFPAELTDHQNGALGVSRVVAFEQEPNEFKRYVQVATGKDKIRETKYGFNLKLGNGKIAVLNAEGLYANYGIEKIPTERGLRFLGLQIRVSDLENTRELLKAAGIGHRVINEQVVVKSAPGQGAFIAFKQTK